MRAFFLLVLINFLFLSNGLAAGTLDQIPHLKSLPDSTIVLQQMIDEQDGNLLLGNDEALRITQPLMFDLAKLKAVAVRATGGVTIVMDGPGSALRFHGLAPGIGVADVFCARDLERADADCLGDRDSREP